MTIPNRVYMQWKGRTWCQDKVFEDDEVFIRQALCAVATEQLKKELASRSLHLLQREEELEKCRRSRMDLVSALMRNNHPHFYLVTPPSSPGLYKVTLADGGPFPHKVVRWTGSMWRARRGWPCCRYLAKWIVNWEKSEYPEYPLR